MKRAIKILTVCALAGLLCMFVTGCDMLDEMKAQHAIISDDMRELEYKGKTFIRLPDNIPYYFNDSYSNLCYTTTEDVPVLLSEEYGLRSYYDSLYGIMAVSLTNWYAADINTYQIYDYYTSESASYMFFCEEEDYHKFSNISYEDADRIGFYEYGVDYNTNILSSSASKEIIDFIYSDNTDNDTYFQLVEQEYYDSIFELYRCNKDMTLRETLYNLEIYFTDKGDVYILNHMLTTAQQLSDETATEIKSEYYGTAW